jgi:hypothetical protein
MLKKKHVFLAITLCWFAVACGASNGNSARPVAEARSTGRIEDEPCRRVIRQYVREKKGWSDRSYEISRESAEVRGNRGFAVTHEADRRKTYANPDRLSFHVDLDGECTKVLVELRYQ